MSKLENLVIHPRGEEITKRVLDQCEEEIKSLLDDLTKFLGEGNTADVRFLGSNDQICIKIFKRTDQIGDAIFYLSPEKEGDFLDSLLELGTKVRVPEVYATFTVTNETGDHHQFLMMENLPAVSIDDVLQDRAELPKDFDLESLQKDLLHFVESMHLRNIYHRDLHEGNIMIDKKTFQPYVIDFGASAEYWGEAVPGERGPYHITKDGMERIVTSDESMIKSVIKKLKAKLTKID